MRFYPSAFCYILFLLTLWGCGSGDSSSGEVVAEVADRSLTRSELDARLPKGLPAADSAREAQRLIQNWKEQAALANAARKQVDGWETRVKPRVQDYEDKLLIYEWEEQTLKAQLDTNVTEAEAAAYYKKNIAQYVANVTLYNYHYVKTDDENTPEFRQRMPSSKIEDVVKVAEWCKKHATIYKLSEEYLDAAAIRRIQLDAGATGLADLAPNSPVKVFSRKENGKEYLHFFYMIDVVKPGRYLPFSHVRAEIVQSILAARRNKILQEQRAKVLQEAGN